MTTQTLPVTVRTVRLAGFSPYFRKEVSTWFRQRGAIVTFLIIAALGTVGTLATRIDQLMGGVPTAAMLDPTASILGAQFDQWVMMSAIFASMGLLIPERSSGTLAWTLSKPMSRASLLLAKWCASVTMLAVFSVILPLAWMMLVATISYGSIPDVRVVATYGTVLVGLPMLFVALNLALATLIDTQAGIAAVAIGVAFAPYFLIALVPPVADLWPSSIARTATALAVGEPASMATVASWAVTIAMAGIAAFVLFAREDV